MSEEDIKKPITEFAPDAKNAKPQDANANSEVAQEVFEAALTSYQTQRKEGMNLSLNGMPMTEAQIDALLKNKTQQDE